MDVEQIRKVGRALPRFLDEFSDCFGRCDTRAYLKVYVKGQLSDLQRKSAEPIDSSWRAIRSVRTRSSFSSRTPRSVHRWNGCCTSPIRVGRSSNA